MGNNNIQIRQLIEDYLSDEELLYKNWYLKKNAKETGVDVGEPIGVISDFKDSFKDWLEKNRTSLVKILCPKKDEILNAKDAVDVVMNIADFIDVLPLVPGVYETASLLFQFGLENLCIGYD